MFSFHRMSRVSDTYKWEEMCDLTEEDMENLLLFFAPNKVPSIEALRALREGGDKPDAGQSRPGDVEVTHRPKE